MDVSEFYEPDYFDVKESPKYKRGEEEWRMSNGKRIKVVDMDDSHLFNAHMKTNSHILFKEMVYRLFERGIF